jgi:DNA-binding NtrC family response regulator
MRRHSGTLSIVPQDETDKKGTTVRLTFPVDDSIGKKAVRAAADSSMDTKFRVLVVDDEPFHVVVSDIEMPILNGRMLAEFIENESPDTDVILMTGWADTHLDIDTISTRVIGLIKKPPRLADITALLAVVARNSGPVISETSGKPDGD